MNAWPAAQTLLYDGWVLRFASGYTRRANSIYPLYPSGLELDEKIRACEMLYRSQRLPVIFKMTAESQPGGLDDHLAGLGYQPEARTSVQLLDLRGWEEPDAPSAHCSGAETAGMAGGLRAPERDERKQPGCAPADPARHPSANVLCLYHQRRSDGGLRVGRAGGGLSGTV